MRTAAQITQRAMDEARQVREGADLAAAETLRLAELQAERIRRRAASQASAAAFELTRSAEAEARHVRAAAKDEAEIICKHARESSAANIASKSDPAVVSLSFSGSHAAPLLAVPTPVLSLTGSGGTKACGGEPASLLVGGGLGGASERSIWNAVERKIATL